MNSGSTFDTIYYDVNIPAKTEKFNSCNFGEKFHR